MTTELPAFLDEARVRVDAIDQRLDTIDTRLDETNRRISVLHEDVIARIALLGEQFAFHAPRRSRKQKFVACRTIISARSDGAVAHLRW